MKKSSLLIAFLFSYLLLAANETMQESSSPQESLSYEKLLEREIVADRVNAEATLSKPYVVMVSLDGFRHDYAERYGAKNILSLKANGSCVRRLIPSFPSKTFPNHYTIATGLYPAHHGIVSNYFYSRERDEIYKLGDRAAVEDGTWYGGVPIWVLAEQQGMLSASFFWVGSEADVKGIHPTYYFPFDSKVPYELRVRKILDWLKLPESKRPHMLTLYYSLTDSIGHHYGPISPEMKEAVLEVDGLIGKLREGLEASGLPVTLIVTSDHGMTEVSNININDYVDLKDNWFAGGPVAMIYTKDDAETQRLYDELSKTDRFDTYYGNALPAYLNYHNADRVGDLVISAKAPDCIERWTEEEPLSYSIKGAHGFDPYTHPDMGGIFYIQGPDIRTGVELAPIENIHIYPLLAHLLNLEMTEPVDGQFDVLAPVLK